MNYQQMQAERQKLKQLANEQASMMFVEYMVKNGLGKNKLREAIKRASK